MIVGPVVVKKSNGMFAWLKITSCEHKVSPLQIEQASIDDFLVDQWQVCAINEANYLIGLIYDPGASERKHYGLLIAAGNLYRIYFRSLLNTPSLAQIEIYHNGYWRVSSDKKPYALINTIEYWEPIKEQLIIFNRDFKSWYSNQHVAPWYGATLTITSSFSFETPLTQIQQTKLRVAFYADLEQLKQESTDQNEYVQALQTVISGNLAQECMSLLSKKTAANVYVLRNWLLPININLLGSDFFYTGLNENEPGYNITIQNALDYLVALLQSELQSITSYTPRETVQLIPDISSNIRIGELKNEDGQLLHRITRGLSSTAHRQLCLLYNALTIGINRLLDEEFYDLYEFINNIQQRNALHQTTDITNDLLAIYEHHDKILTDDLRTLQLLLTARYIMVFKRNSLLKKYPQLSESSALEVCFIELILTDINTLPDLWALILTRCANYNNSWEKIEQAQMRDADYYNFFVVLEKQGRLKSLLLGSNPLSHLTSIKFYPDEINAMPLQMLMQAQSSFVSTYEQVASKGNVNTFFGQWYVEFMQNCRRHYVSNKIYTVCDIKIREIKHQTRIENIHFMSGIPLKKLDVDTVRSKREQIKAIIRSLFDISVFLRMARFSDKLSFFQAIYATEQWHSFEIDHAEMFTIFHHFLACYEDEDSMSLIETVDPNCIQLQTVLQLLLDSRALSTQQLFETLAFSVRKTFIERYFGLYISLLILNHGVDFRHLNQNGPAFMLLRFLGETTWTFLFKNMSWPKFLEWISQSDENVFTDFIEFLQTNLDSRVRLLDYIKTNLDSSLHNLTLVGLARILWLCNDQASFVFSDVSFQLSCLDTSEKVTGFLTYLKTKYSNMFESWVYNSIPPTLISALCQSLEPTMSMTTPGHKVKFKTVKQEIMTLWNTRLAFTSLWQPVMFSKAKTSLDIQKELLCLLAKNPIEYQSRVSNSLQKLANIKASEALPLSFWEDVEIQGTFFIRLHSPLILVLAMFLVAMMAIVTQKNVISSQTAYSP